MWSATHPWKAVGGWLVFVLLCFAAGPLVGANNATTEDYRVGEAGRAEAMIADARLTRAPVERILIDNPTGALDERSVAAAVEEVTVGMRSLPEVAGVEPPERSADGRTVLVTVAIHGAELAAREVTPKLMEKTEQVQRAHPDLRIQQTGKPSLSRGLDEQRAADLALSEAITLPITLITLLIVFGSVLAAGVPLLLSITSILASMGVATVMSHLFPDAGVGASVIILIGLAVGVDYSLFYLKRDHEERARAGGGLDEAALVRIVATTSGRAVVMSGAAVIVSTATLFLATDVIFDSLATAAIIAVLMAVLSSLTVLPALLAGLGRRERAVMRTPRPPTVGRRWAALLRPATRRPRLTLVLSVGLMLLLALPAFSLRLSVPGSDTFSRKIPAVGVYDRFTDAFPDHRITHVVVVRTSVEDADEARRRLDALGESAAADPLFSTTVRPVVRTSADQRVSTLELAVPFNPGTAQARESLSRVRDDFVPATVGALPAAEYAVTGDIPRAVDYAEHQSSVLPRVIGLLLLATFVMTVIAFRSVVLGLVGVLLNLLSAAGAFGLLVLVFQGTWAQGLLGFTSTGAIGSRVPLFLFVILFGLSMDYQVFVVSRIREAVAAGLPTRRAVFEGIGGSASVVTSAAVVMMTVFAAFVALSLVEMKQIGFGLAVAVLLDAFVIRAMILPAIMVVLGERSWWPVHPTGRRLDRRAQPSLDES